MKILKWLIYLVLFMAVSLWSAYVGVYYGGFDPPHPPPSKVLQMWLKAKEVVDFKQVQTGDLILRRGDGAISDLFRQLSLEDKTYSHSGLCKRTKDGIFVYHSLGDETNPDNKLCLDPVGKFCTPAGNSVFAVYRFDFTPKQIKRLEYITNKYYEKGVTFDFDFSLKTDDKMYCSEFVYKSLIYAAGDKNYLSVNDKEKGEDKAYVTVDNLYVNKHCKLIFKYNYD